MTSPKRDALIETARRSARWPDDDWVRRHADDHMPARMSPRQYRDLTQAVKKRPHTIVRAFINDAYSGGTGDLARSLAFIDPDKRMMVWVDVATMNNVTCMYLTTTAEQFLTEKGTRYWEVHQAAVETGDQP
jgi:hypothetical protein